jgi:hypothetical protein
VSVAKTDLDKLQKIFSAILDFVQERETFVHQSDSAIHRFLRSVCQSQLRNFPKRVALPCKYQPLTKTHTMDRAKLRHDIKNELVSVLERNYVSGSGKQVANSSY